MEKNRHVLICGWYSHRECERSTIHSTYMSKEFKMKIKKKSTKILISSTKEEDRLRASIIITEH